MSADRLARTTGTSGYQAPRGPKNMIPLMKSAFLREDETRRALSQFILSAPRLSMDAKCREFEQAFADFQGRREAILFNSGGSANLALLQALQNLGKLRAGDRVGFSALTWSTNTMPIIQLGMVPVPVDCEPTTLNVMSKDLAARLAGTELQALFLTNALGFAGDLGRIKALCGERGILLLEDNCESLGTELPDGKAGNFGLAATFSFYVAHHMSTIEGGMVCTDDDELAEMLRIVRANGWDRNLTPAQQAKWRAKYGIDSHFKAQYAFYDLGFNLRPTEITGFIGIEQLKYVRDTFGRREQIYLRLEAQARRNGGLLALDRSHITRLSNFAFPVVCRSARLKEELLRRFVEANVEVRPLIAGNIQRQPFYSKYADRVYELPGADFLDDCGFYCGNYPDMAEADLQVLENLLRA